MRTHLYISTLLVLSLVLGACEMGRPSSSTSIKESPNTAPAKSEDKKPAVNSSEPQHLPGPDYKLESSKTTLVQTIASIEPAVPAKDTNSDGVIDENDIPKNKLDEFGKFKIGEGESYIERNDLGITESAETSADAKSILYFAAISDIHIIDTESPLRFVSTDTAIQYAYRPQEIYSTQILDAMVRTLNDFSKERPYDFFITLGDDTNSNQYNETRWFIDILDGEVVTPDSGDHLDVKPGQLNDHHDTFLAWGLDKKVPWYSLIGNHDALVVGVFEIKDKDQTTATGDTVYLGSLDNAGNIIPPDTKVTKDDNRKLLEAEGFMDEFFNTAAKPAGHGFTEANQGSGFGNYTLDANNFIRIIALDTICRTGGVSMSEGCMSNDQLNKFLIPELDKAKEEKKLVIIMMHHGTNYFDKKLSEVTAETYINTVTSYPNVILNMVGHGHNNKIVAHKGNDTNPGYYEVETSSLVDFPQQARVVELSYAENGILKIYLTMVDHNSPEGSMSYIARELALKDLQLGNNKDETQGKSEARNAILTVSIPSEINEIISATAGSLPTKIESETTLQQ